MTDYVPDKWIWTEADFEQMGWHDIQIRAIAFRPANFEFVLDIDYIFQWVQPQEDSFYRFWVSPATLVFKNVYDLRIDLEPYTEVCILEVNRTEPSVPRNAKAIGAENDWHWLLGCTAGEIGFRSIGFDQYTRRFPKLSKAQSLTEEERGGFSFARTVPEGAA